MKPESINLKSKSINPAFLAPKHPAGFIWLIYWFQLQLIDLFPVSSIIHSMNWFPGIHSTLIRALHLISLIALIFLGLLLIHSWISFFIQSIHSQFISGIHSNFSILSKVWFSKSIRKFKLLISEIDQKAICEFIGWMKSEANQWNSH